MKYYYNGPEDPIEEETPWGTTYIDNDGTTYDEGGEVIVEGSNDD